jgi:DNA-binding winged helix-turn-helix (wHTH) protein
VNLLYKEADFPADYRAAEVSQIMSALYRRRSIAITGLAGMGKSNVVRFMASHPKVRSRYLQERANDYRFVHVDCAGLIAATEVDLLGEVLFQLRHGEADPSRDLSSVWRAIKAAVLDLSPDLDLVFILDYFDELAAILSESFYNRLFHLRNTRPQGNVSYVFVTRRPLMSLYELQELLDDGCLVGPLGHKDALDSIRRDEERLGCAFSPAQQERLIACTGGHPGFLKNASELLCSGYVDFGLSDDVLIRRLLQSDKVRNLCQELWDDLTPMEQALLAGVARGDGLSSTADPSCVAALERSGVLVLGVPVGMEVASIFSPLFEGFVRAIGGAPGTIHITAEFPNRARISAAGGEKRVTLSPKLFALLAALSEAQGDVLTTDDLIHRVYGNEAFGVTNAALSQLVKRLRAAIDPCVRRLTKDQAYTCVETVRDVGYKLNG